jgi:hypothetical protein
MPVSLAGSPRLTREGSSRLAVESNISMDTSVFHRSCVAVATKLGVALLRDGADRSRIRQGQSDRLARAKVSCMKGESWIGSWLCENEI